MLPTSIVNISLHHTQGPLMPALLLYIASTHLSLLLLRPQVSSFSLLYIIANMLHSIECMPSCASMDMPTFCVIIQNSYILKWLFLATLNWWARPLLVLNCLAKP